jgi:hypothetical protein
VCSRKKKTKRNSEEKLTNSICSVTLKIRPRSPIFKLVWDLDGKHTLYVVWIWWPCIKMLRSYWECSGSAYVYTLYTLWPWELGQGHPTCPKPSNLPEALRGSIYTVWIWPGQANVNTQVLLCEKVGHPRGVSEIWPRQSWIFFGLSHKLKIWAGATVTILCGYHYCCMH